MNDPLRPTLSRRQLILLALLLIALLVTLKVIAGWFSVLVVLILLSLYIVSTTIHFLRQRLSLGDALRESTIGSIRWLVDKTSGFF